MKIYNKILELLRSGTRIKNLNEKVNELTERIIHIQNSQQDSKILIAKIYERLLSENKSLTFAESEFKVFSQYGDDGIIQFLIRKLNITSKTFVEFGVEAYKEANTRFLLIHNNWKGLIMDGSESNIQKIKADNIYWQHNLTAIPVFITRENINKLLSENGFKGETGILHIDIDGNDYWVWDEITVIQPQVVIMEYNAVFGLNPWTVPYDEKFYRTEKHHSNLYFGASLAALNSLAEKKGYSLVGCNSHGNNAYFVRNDKLTGMRKLELTEAFVDSEFRESRDTSGKLTFVSEGNRINLIKNLPVFNTASGKVENI